MRGRRRRDSAITGLPPLARPWGRTPPRSWPARPLSAGTVRPALGQRRLPADRHAGGGHGLRRLAQAPLDIGEVWLNPATWASITDPAWLYQRWQGSPYTLVVTVPMLPAGVPRVSIKACARGAYNAHWRQFGQVIHSYGLGSSIIRLGWEFNGKWSRWAATDPTAWARCCKQAVTSARSTAPGLRWDWNVNRVSPLCGRPTRAYPGNDYVSMIGVDSYDQCLCGERRLASELDGEQG